MRLIRSPNEIPCSSNVWFVLCLVVWRFFESRIVETVPSGSNYFRNPRGGARRWRGDLLLPPNAALHDVLAARLAAHPQGPRRGPTIITILTKSDN